MSDLCIDFSDILMYLGSLLQQALCSQIELGCENDENVKLNRDPPGTRTV